MRCSKCGCPLFKGEIMCPDCLTPVTKGDTMAATTIKIKLDPNAKAQIVPKVNVNGDWIDLYIMEPINLKAGEDVRVSLGVAMELPPGYEAHILPRSSMFEKTGLLLTNSMGMIDNSYNGNDDYWSAHVYATRDVNVEAGTRLFQFRIEKNQPDVKFELVTELTNKNRGGYGSTGTT